MRPSPPPKINNLPNYETAPPPPELPTRDIEADNSIVFLQSLIDAVKMIRRGTYYSCDVNSGERADMHIAKAEEALKNEIANCKK